ncbi:WecB/TagA/CpsF family glycosyltransferase [Alkaliphilus oremlandii]|uniref:N-acetylglucosaminyldiphosphoundecaprenol N-acetyl-beta-D-mannosaminyltransferase n=1 Tax=Alkaliphilus oremlandii (strain OhILAs) TaxID=350688 RepID=A8MJ20_ALKOO|nr:WecB/TagA/CpsF family glycosyltransferase [Alkaliphilus oremlandii]ABW19802.1 glycosyl transferase, WecB/TagA/CpsF family [Alkaliphilus oremlandii OhILAs]
MRKQERVLGVNFDVVDESQALNILIDFLEKKSVVRSVYTPNPEIVMLAQEDRDLYRILKEADLVLADGIGVILASKIKGLELKDRVTGVDTMDKLLQYCGKNKKSIFILGGKPGVAELACKNIDKKYPGIQIAGYHHGYFMEAEEPEIIHTINEAHADILFVCFGAPKQEKWIDKNKSKLNCAIAMGVGGSVDVYAGVVKRAPVAFQKLGLEWFYRLLKEPTRLKRMMVLPKFLIKVIVTKE